MSVKTINRRTLHHNLAQVLDEVVDTAEPVRVESREGRAVVISKDDNESTWDRWVRTGVIIPGKQTSPRSWTKSEP